MEPGPRGAGLLPTGWSRIGGGSGKAHGFPRRSRLARLRKRSLGGKRALALREFALGLEALERFVAREPLRRVHECVFGVLALESEPVDPRL